MQWKNSSVMLFFEAYMIQNESLDVYFIYQEFWCLCFIVPSPPGPVMKSCKIWVQIGSMVVDL